RGVDVVYDAVGAATFEGSLNSLKRLGMLVSFGNASGKVPAFEPVLLSAKGSLFFTRPTLMDYIARREDLLSGAAVLFQALQSGVLKVEISHSYALREAATAQRDLESRQTTGSILLLP
ncbi:MAG: zinc-binding dehydrogenase, partial [Burkholderiales bacterium]